MVADIITAIGPFLVDMFIANPLGTLAFVVMTTMAAAVYYSVARPLKRLQNRVLEPAVVRHQMNKTDEILSNIEQLLMSDWLGIRKNVDGVDKEDLFDDGEQHRFDKVLYKVRDKLTDKIRFFFHENHHAVVSDDAAELHFKERAETLWGFLHRLLDENYWSKARPSRIEHFESMQYLKPAVIQSFIDIFEAGRDTAIRFESDKETRRRHLER
jgi:hypothetical protein